MDFEELSLGQIILWGFIVLFVMWIVSGGPTRLENKYNPFIEPLVEPLGDGSVYGSGGQFQTGIENLIQEGIYVGWNIQNREDFAFLTPPNWTSSVKGNFDNTEFGEITNGSITLEYQYGREIQKLEFENNPNYQVEHGTVQGEFARFVKPKNNSVQTTGAYIRKNRRKQISIFTNQQLTSEEERQVFEIINTVKM